MNDLSMLVENGVLALLASASGLFLSVSAILAALLSLLRSVNLTFRTSSSPLQTNAMLAESSNDTRMVIPRCFKGCKACILTWLEFLLTSLLRSKR